MRMVRCGRLDVAANHTDSVAGLAGRPVRSTGVVMSRARFRLRQVLQRADAGHRVGEGKAQAIIVHPAHRPRLLIADVYTCPPCHPPELEALRTIEIFHGPGSRPALRWKGCRRAWTLVRMAWIDERPICGDGGQSAAADPRRKKDCTMPAAGCWPGRLVANDHTSGPMMIVAEHVCIADTFGAASGSCVMRRLWCHS